MESSKSRDDNIHRAMQILYLVHELHSQGFQRLRICPYFTNNVWHCQITPATNVERERGAKPIDLSVGPTYSAVPTNEHPHWLNDSNDIAEKHAKEFRQRFPEIVEQSKGDDKKYVDWYRKMLAYADRGHLPYGFSESVTEKETQSESYPTGSLFHLARNSNQEYARGLKTPPGGEGRALQSDNCDLIEEMFASEGSRGVDGREYDQGEANFWAELKVVKLSGKWDLVFCGYKCELDLEEAVYFQELLSHPGEYISTSEFRTLHPELGETFRPDLIKKKLKKKLSSEIFRALETHKSRGTRIRYPRT